jgi:predicted secreted acid phosphatase
MTSKCRQLRIRLAWLLALNVVGSLCALGAIAEPINYAEIKGPIAPYVAYYDSGYRQDLAAVDAWAAAWIAWRAPFSRKPALVLDIDETSLSNWPEMLANKFAYVPDGPCHLPKGPCGMLAWDSMAKAKAIVPTLALFKLARSAGVSIFFITGRHERERAATERNLRRAGYVDVHGRKGWVALKMEPNDLKPASAADFKAPARARMESAGYDIVANIGDQESDLAGGYAERRFKLPNPFYRIP